jgi:SpoVK/Ycf46/Vps4 family AAA+-type ATPase
MFGYGVPVARDQSLAGLQPRNGRASPRLAPRGVDSPADCESLAKGRPVAAQGQAAFRTRPPRHRLEQVVLPEITRREIARLLARIHHHDLLYREWGLNEVDPAGDCLAINLYGPPGTGKSMCADALAAELGRSLVEVSYAELESKYVGETPKNICAAFGAARAADAVLFFDEADSILGRRMTNVTQAADHSVNVSRAVMLKQLDAFAGVVLFATNLAKNFDGAFVRRILMHVEVPPPDLAGRKLLWQRMIGARVPGRERLDWDALAEMSAGLCGGEIKNAAVIALSEAAARNLEERRIRAEDLACAIESVHKAKREVGRYDYDAG